MKKITMWSIQAALIIFTYSAQTQAEVRREGGEQSNKKTQYMIRQLHAEKNELKAKLVKSQGEFSQLEKEHEVTKKRLDKSSDNNEKLLSRVKGDVKKFKELADKYRESVLIPRKANLDNQYMVRAVQEREQWVSNCGNRNNDLFEANNDLLHKYGEVAGDSIDIFTGIGSVTVENEVQDYRFKLEDLQVTKFKPAVDAASHTRQQEQGIASERDAMATTENETVNVN